MALFKFSYVAEVIVALGGESNYRRILDLSKTAYFNHIHGGIPRKYWGEIQRYLPGLIDEEFSTLKTGPISNSHQLDIVTIFFGSNAKKVISQL